MENTFVVNSGGDVIDKLEIIQKEGIADAICDLGNTGNVNVNEELNSESSADTGLTTIGNKIVSSDVCVMENTIETIEGNNSAEDNGSLQPSESSGKEIEKINVNKEDIALEKCLENAQVEDHSKTTDSFKEHFTEKSDKHQECSDMDLNFETNHVDINQLESFIQEVIDDLDIADMDLEIESCNKCKDSNQDKTVKDSYNEKTQDKCAYVESTVVEYTDHLADDLEHESNNCAASHCKNTNNTEGHLHMKPKVGTLCNGYHVETVGYRTNATASGNLNKADKAKSNISGDIQQKELKVAKEQTNIPLYINKIQPEDMTMEQMECLTLRRALESSQKRLLDEKARGCLDMMKIKFELYQTKTQHRQEKIKSDKMLTDVMSHLILLEGQLKQEQKKLQVEMKSKNELIEKQKQELVKLRDQNEQLYNAIKEICANGGMNGYMRDKKKKGNHFDASDNGGKENKEKKSYGKLGSMRDKFSSKNRSSLELTNFNLEKYLIKDARMCSSQDDIHTLCEEPKGSNQNAYNGTNGSQKCNQSSVERMQIVERNTNEQCQGQHLGDDLNQSDTKTCHISDRTFSTNDHVSSPTGMSVTNHGYTNRQHHIYDDDDDDNRIFSFSSTHINTVINEEETLGPIVSYSGSMMSMGSMPMLTNVNDEYGLSSEKERPHSLTSVDLMTVVQQQQTQHLADVYVKNKLGIQVSTPPQSPSYVHGKGERTPFQAFKTMFKWKGSKAKESKKRSLSLSQTTNGEYTEALKKHFQKYDMQ